MEAPTTPPQASFLGLPAELRLRIYEYLFVSDSSNESYCCSLNKSCGPNSACFSKHKNSFPNVLRLCKQVFAESYPVLYQHLEVGLAIPTDRIWRSNGGISVVAEVRLLERLPAYGAKHIRDVQFTSTTHLLTGSGKSMAELCSFLEVKLPNLQHIQLDLRLDEPIPLDVYSISLGPIAKISSVKSVHSELEYDLSLPDDSLTMEEIQDAADAIGDTFASHGKNFTWVTYDPYADVSDREDSEDIEPM
jgi:hypothetical protein